MTGWQPIETAPRDGTKILVVLGDTMAVVAWDEMTAELNEGSGWSDMGDIGWGGYHDAWPTHWMPLPAPPIV